MNTKRFIQFFQVGLFFVYSCSKTDPQPEIRLTIEPDVLIFNAEGNPMGLNQVSVYSNTDWQVINPGKVDWLHFENKTGSGDGLLTFAVMPNTGLTRETSLRVLYSGTFREIAIQQQAADMADKILSPDFRDYCLKNFDSDGDGILTRAEILRIKTMEIENKWLQDLSGIELFTSLERLRCPFNSLRLLDLTANTALKELDCSHNSIVSLLLPEGVQTLNCSSNKIFQLKLSDCTALYYINCQKNGMYTLELPDTGNLVSLDCDWNRLTELDVSGCPELTNLVCGENNFPRLDISNNRKLERLWAGSNSSFVPFTLLVWDGFDLERPSNSIADFNLSYNAKIEVK